jgi:hypothetical protein
VITLQTNLIKGIVFSVMLVLPSVQGCISGGVRSHNVSETSFEDKSLSSWLVAGKTTKREVLSRFGPPNSPENFSEALKWRYIWSQQSRLVIIPLSPKIVGQEQILTLSFTEDGHLISYKLDEQSPHFQKGDEPKGVFNR